MNVNRKRLDDIPKQLRLLFAAIVMFVTMWIVFIFVTVKFFPDLYR